MIGWNNSVDRIESGEEIPGCQEERSPKESWTKSREWMSFFKLFLKKRIANSDAVDEDEDGWKWIARHGLERRISLINSDGRLIWPLPQYTPPSSPIAIRGLPTLRLGRFCKRWNHKRRLARTVIGPTRIV